MRVALSTDAVPSRRGCLGVAGATLASLITMSAAVYEVGPNLPLATPGEVPWESLAAGDEVRIHWQAEPYRDKWVICAAGTEAEPIRVSGVAGPDGALPVIDGRDAVTRQVLNYWNEPRGVVKIGGASVPADTTPSHIIVENLEIRSGRPPYSFSADDGMLQNYPNNAAAIYLEKGENVVIRNCRLHDCGNGLFVSYESRDVLVERCEIYDNGNEGSIYEHNSYTAAQGITFQFNHYGPLRTGCLGNNLKDRSAGLVVRYNWIEGGNRQLDLVDGEDSPLIRDHPDYHRTFVYGNVLVETEGSGNRQVVHYGGDSGDTAGYRKGTLFFHHNTVVSTRTDRTTLFRLSTNEEQCDARNNVVYVSAAGDTLSWVDGSGQLRLAHNWFKPGAVDTFGTLTGSIVDAGGHRTGAVPGFLDEPAQDYRLAAGSACIDAGTALDSAAIAHLPSLEYRRHRQSAPRRMDQSPDLGAFEYSPNDATVLDVLPAADTALLELEPDFNLGGQADYPSGTLGPSAGNTRSRVLVRFDLSGLPMGAVIQSAVFRCTVVRQPDAPEESVFALHRMLSPWNEGTGVGGAPGGSPAQAGETTWNESRFGAGAWAEAGGLAGVDYALAPSGREGVAGLGTYEIEIGATGMLDLEDWRSAPASNHGWMLMSEAEETPKTARRFASREAAADPPRLVVHYVAAPAAPRIIDLRVLPDAVALSFQAEANVAYVWEERASLLSGSWRDVLNIPASPAGGLVLATNPAAPGALGFIRLRLGP